jgi:hypothetical protein
VLRAIGIALAIGLLSLAVAGWRPARSFTTGSVSSHERSAFHHSSHGRWHAFEPLPASWHERETQVGPFFVNLGVTSQACPVVRRYLQPQGVTS